jgi:hypothetical protein
VVRLLTLAVLAGGIGAAPAALATEPARSSFRFGADVGWVDASGHASFLDYGPGKLRFDEDDDLVLSRTWFDYRYRLADTVTAQIAAEGYADDIGGILDLTEAFVEWKPLAATANRYRVKFGAFYPRLSLENVDAGWASPYTITPSAINTWIGEELRAFGAEFGVSRRPQSLGGRHSFSLFGSVYWKNDPAGTLLSWKGWSMHDRQTRFGDEIPMPPVPQIQAGAAFEAQAPYVEPFKEIDDRAGWYLGADWAVDRRLLLRAMHYDNRADPVAFEDGQFGWHTRFDSLGIQAGLPGEVGLVAQWLRGSTVWGYFLDGVRFVDADFTAVFVLLTRRFERHRVSLRYDRFEITENDSFPMDANGEVGRGWTAAYAFDVSEKLAIAAEWLSIRSERPAWEYFGLSPARTETQLQLQARLRFTL